MKKFLASLTALSALAPMALAEVQFDILLDDMINNVDCFNQATCGPADGHALITNLGNQIQYTVPIAFTGPDGFPLAYQFVVQGDNILPAGGNQIDYWEVNWTGPGFRYTFSQEFAPFTNFYLPGPANPPETPSTIDPADGCYNPPVPEEWTWENFPNGIVELTQDFTLADGHTLFVEAGITAYALAGVSINIDGTIDAQGSFDAPIHFTGDNWAGINFGGTATGSVHHASIHGVMDDSNGGAVYLATGADVTFNYATIAHNTTTGNGGGAFLETGSFLRLRSCTLSHNTANSGGNIYVSDGGFVTGMYNLVTFGTPETMFAETGVIYSNLQSSMLYPLDNPGGSTGWYCDPGYVDAENGNFYPSFWNTEDPTIVNCMIDVSLITEDVDPDGTPRDMGSVPFNQFEILRPATIDMVMDRDADQGSNVILHFDASPNDGSWINPITFYSVWVMYPGMDHYISTGQTVGALGQEHYAVVVPTLLDSTSTNGNNDSLFVHSFIVSAHNSTNPLLVALSDPMGGYSIDNIAPGAVTGFDSEDWVELPLVSSFNLEVSWNPSSANDLDHYELSFTDPDGGGLQVLGSFSDTQYSHTVPYTNNLGDVFVYTVYAYDHAGNRSLVSTYTAPAIPTTGVEESMPLTFALDQNYPNPFNPTTTVRYDLAKTTDVSLRVYNMQGQMVRELVNGQQNAGRYELQFNADNLASGVYVYHLQAGDFSQTRKMVLMK